MELLEPEEAIVIVKHSGLLYSKKCAVTNVILTISILAVIITGIVFDSMSSYQKQTSYEYGGITMDESGGYFECGWGIYVAHFEEDNVLYSSGSQTWYYGHTECLRLGHGGEHSSYSCDWYKIPNQSGLVWCILNISGCMPIFMALLLYIVCLFNNTFTRELYNKRRIFKITFCLFLLAAICILSSVLYWIKKNEETSGCWTEHYQYVVDTQYAGDPDANGAYYWYRFEHKQLGISMICDIVALAMLSSWAFVYLLVLCQCCTVCGIAEECEAKITQQNTIEMLKQHEVQESTNNSPYRELDSNSPAFSR
eukprot:381169_1